MPVKKLLAGYLTAIYTGILCFAILCINTLRWSQLLGENKEKTYMLIESTFLHRVSALSLSLWVF